jgi:uncharacterized protein with NAD-binding domain and iron-sulfur cluster
MKKIIIIGGGIAGLTTAHELLKKDFEVHLFESTSKLGGMAKCVRNNDGIIEEYSWRGYGPFYNNFFDIAKQIPINNSHEPNHPLVKNNRPCVLNNLTHDKINFVGFKNNEKFVYSGELEFIENIKGYYDILKYILSNNRRKEDSNILLTDYVKNYYNENTHDVIINHIVGPGLGMDRNTISKKLLLDTISKVIFNSKLDSYVNWRVTTLPTNEAWFDPWEQYLRKHNNFKLYFNSTLMKINYSNKKITSVTINIDGNIQNIYGDEFIISINPFNLQDILINSNMDKLQNKNKNIINKSINNQISFRIGFNKPIKYHKINSGFTFLDSDLNITLYPVENSWNKDVKLDNKGQIKSLWSGTVVDSTTIIKKYNKTGIELTREELFEEILNEIFISKSFNEYIYKHNQFYITNDDIIYKELFKEYEFNGGKLYNKNNKKWVNNICNDKYFFDQKTEFNNMYIGGAHTKTSLSKYSMEAATESGKIIANHILTKYNYDKCYHYVFKNKFFFKLDDLLYKMNLPNIIDIITTFSVIFIIIKIYNDYRKK